MSIYFSNWLGLVVVYVRQTSYVDNTVIIMFRKNMFLSNIFFINIFLVMVFTQNNLMLNNIHFQKRVLIIGSGVIGLTTAYLLLENGSV